MTALTPIDKSIRLSHQMHQKLIRLGHDIEANRLEQLRILYWFYEDEERVKRLGYDSFIEYFAQEDVQGALGLSAESKGARSKLWNEFKISALIPEADVMGEGRSKVAAALPVLRPMADAILQDIAERKPREEIEAAKRDLWRAVDEYRAQPVREVEAEVQTRREPPFLLTSNAGHPAIGQVDGETGEIEPVLVCADDCDKLGFATAVRRLTRQYDSLFWDEDGLWTWAAEGIMKPVARWSRRDVPREIMLAVADACRAERRI